MHYTWNIHMWITCIMMWCWCDFSVRVLLKWHPYLHSGVKKKKELHTKELQHIPSQVPLHVNIHNTACLWQTVYHLWKAIKTEWKNTDMSVKGSLNFYSRYFKIWSNFKKKMQHIYLTVALQYLMISMHSEILHMKSKSQTENVRVRLQHHLMVSENGCHHFSTGCRYQRNTTTSAVDTFNSVWFSFNSVWHKNQLFN